MTAFIKNIVACLPHSLFQLLILLTGLLAACSGQQTGSYDLLHDFASMHRDAEDLTILFGTTDQSQSQTIGFSIDEYHDDRYYCWMLGHEGTVRFYLAELSRVAVLASVKPFVPPGKPLQRLKLACNGVPAGDHVLPLGWSDQHFPLPDTALCVGWNTLSFECRYTWVPAHDRGEGEKSDNRQIGVAFERLQFIKESFGGLRLPERRIIQRYDDKGTQLIEQAPGTRFSTYHYVQPGSILVAECTVSEENGEGTASTHILIARITVTPEQGEPISFSVKLLPRSTRNSAVLSLDLARFATRLVRIEMTVERTDVLNQQVVTWVQWRQLALKTKKKPVSAIQKRIPSEISLNSNRNLVIMLIDTLRSDALGCYGNNYNTSPNIDRFSRKSFLYTRGRSQSSWTRPSVASLFTGLLPEHHGVLESDSALSLEAPRYNSLLKNRGYTTAAVTSNPQISEYFGFAKDFDYFVEVFNGVRPVDLKPELLDRLINIDSLLEATASHLTGEQAMHSPFFLYLHVMDPHSPYSPPTPYGELCSVEPGAIALRPAPPGRKKQNEPITDILKSQILEKYFGEVRFTDRGFARLLDLLRKRSDKQFPLIAIVGDHGEEFWEHGGMGHGRWVFEETLNVPVIIGPTADGRIMDTIVEIRRLFSELQLDAPFDEKTNDRERPLFFVDELSSEKTMTFWHSATDGVFKCTIRTRATGIEPAVLETSFYNLEEDSLEQDDLSGKRPLLEGYFVERIRKNLIKTRKNSFRIGHNQERNREKDQMLHDQLKILGYTDS